MSSIDKLALRADTNGEKKGPGLIAGTLFLLACMAATYVATNVVLKWAANLE
ncbi:MAG: hypothetical protein AAB439_00245 [Patescibacteria group bacterium]